MGYKLTARARADLKEIVIYTRKTWGKEQEKLYREDLRKALRSLALSLKLGRVRKELGEGLRSFQIAHHIVYYVEKKNGIEIARILHPSMEIESQLNS